MSTNADRASLVLKQLAADIFTDLGCPTFKDETEAQRFLDMRFTAFLNTTPQRSSCRVSQTRLSTDQEGTTKP